MLKLLAGRHSVPTLAYLSSHVMFLYYTLQPQAYCAFWVRRSNFRHQASPRVSPSGGRWNCEREMSGNFA